MLHGPHPAIPIRGGWILPGAFYRVCCMMGRMTRFWTMAAVFGAVAAGLVAYAGASLWVEAATPAVPRVANEAQRDFADPAITPHKAVYKIEMISKRSTAQVLNISGEMLFEWKIGCDAWMTDHRFNLFYEYADSSPMRITSDFTTYEMFRGDSFSFNSRRRRDGELYEELRGHASASADSPGQAVFSMPEGLTYTLAPGSLFPMAHTVSVLRAARGGQKFFAATIFDGSDEEGPAEISAFIGKPVNAMARMTPNAKIDTALINTPAWQVRLAFFPLSSTESDSDYEMDLILHDNGVISDMVVDYKDFSVAQKLIGLEPLPKASCGPAPRNGQTSPGSGRIKP